MLPADWHGRAADGPRSGFDAGQHVMTVCNACRYCEQFCPVFPAMERRLTFTQPDLTYLANLCHNCGECLYACQYAPPHEFGINVPRALAEVRALSYETYCWPGALAKAFRRNNLLTGLGLAALLSAVMLLGVVAANAPAIETAGTTADFYAVVPHRVMVTLFGGVALFVSAAIGIACARFWRDIHRGDGLAPTGPTAPPPPQASVRPVIAPARPALRDVLTLRHLQGGGVDCPSDLAAPSPWRRRFHHSTFYGFMLCFASTSVAAVYHSVFGWQAPYAYTSLPVVLGTAGGLGLLVGPAGLSVLRRRRDAALGDPSQQGLDQSFLALLFLTSLTGLALLVLRHQVWMWALLVVHLGVVLALFVTLPYGKFVHGFYRALALLAYHRESQAGPGH